MAQPRKQKPDNRPNIPKGPEAQEEEGEAIGEKRDKRQEDKVEWGRLERGSARREQQRQGDQGGKVKRSKRAGWIQRKSQREGKEK